VSEKIHGFFRLLGEHLDESSDDGVLTFRRVGGSIVVFETAEFELVEFDDGFDDELGFEGGEVTFGEDGFGDEEDVGEEEEEAIFDGLGIEEETKTKDERESISHHRSSFSFEVQSEGRFQLTLLFTTCSTGTKSNSFLGGLSN